MLQVSRSTVHRTGSLSLLTVIAMTLAACMGTGASNNSGAAVSIEQPADTTAKPVPKMSSSSIPVLVNDVPITAYDIDQRARLMRLGGGKSSPQMAREELIDETLEMLEAARRGLNIPQAQIDAAFASIASRLKMSPAQLTTALAGQGIQAASLKKRLQAQISWQQLVQQRTMMKASVKNDAVSAALAEKSKDTAAMTITEYTLQQIIFVVPKGSPAGAYSQRKNEAAAFRQRFPGCDQSLEKAKLLRGVVVKNIGRRDSTQLGDAMVDQLSKTQVGSTIPPSQTAEGVELIAVCDTHSIQSTGAARTEVQNDLYLKQAEGLGKDYLKELRDHSIIEYR